MKKTKDINLLDFEIKNGGKNLSGGQKQRISIANALAKDFDLLILDDSFSSLDSITSKKIQENIYKLCKEKTIIIISQRVSDVKNADNIIVIENRHVLSQGSHEFLKEHCEEYKDFLNIQAKEEV